DSTAAQAESQPDSAAESVAEDVVTESGDELPDAGADSTAEEPKTESEVEEPANAETPDPVNLTFRLEKTLTVDEVPEEDQTYTFRMKASAANPSAESGEPKPEETETEEPKAEEAQLVFAASEFTDEKLELVKQASFPTVTYATEGQWTYEITEVKGEDAATVYDDTIHTVTVTVNTVDGVLVPSIVYADSKPAPAKEGEASESGQESGSESGEKKGEEQEQRADVKTLTADEQGVTEPLPFSNVRSTKVTPATLKLQTYTTLKYTQYISKDKKTQVSMAPVKNAAFKLLFTEQKQSDGEETDKTVPVTFNYKSIPAVAKDKTSRTIYRKDELPALSFTEAGTYTYELSEENSGARGYTYDSKKYTLVVETEKINNVITIKSVKANGTEIWDAAAGINKLKTLRFDNTYVPEKASMKFKINKEVTGTDNSTDTFEFELRGKASAAGKKGALKAKASVKSEGEAVFSKTSSAKNADVFTFAYPSTYTYVASEIDKYAGYAPESDWVCTVKVKDAGGWLEPNVTWKRGNEVQTGKDYIPTFTNRFVTTTFTFNKVDAASVSTGLGGAVFEVYRIASRDKTSDDYKKTMDLLSGGKVDYNSLKKVGTVKSDASGKVSISGLMTSTCYVIKETSAPKGYHRSANPIILRTSWKASSESVATTIVSSGNMTIGKSGSSLRWYDHKVAVRIDKVNADGKLIKGAKMQLLDSNGNILEKWSSGRTKGHAVKAALTIGATYTIHEVKAPKGFNIAEDVTFKVEAYEAGGYTDKVLQVVTVLDTGWGSGTDAVTGGSDGTGTGDGTVTNADGSSTKTGDNSNMLLWAVVMVLAAAALIGIAVTGKKKKK
ncbi:MAG: FctA domain-containing protein, partial [Lachnospiraceae bacterium]|nr:FctA domain-containing protein [Lachnospiraceae bacterium]